MLGRVHWVLDPPPATLVGLIGYPPVGTLRASPFGWGLRLVWTLLHLLAVVARRLLLAHGRSPGSGRPAGGALVDGAASPVAGRQRSRWRRGPPPSRGSAGRRGRRPRWR